MHDSLIWTFDKPEDLLRFTMYHNFFILEILEFNIIERNFWCSHIWPFRFNGEKNIQ